MLRCDFQLCSNEGLKISNAIWAYSYYMLFSWRYRRVIQSILYEKITLPQWTAKRGDLWFSWWNMSYMGLLAMPTERSTAVNRGTHRNSISPLWSLEDETDI